MAKIGVGSGAPSTSAAYLTTVPGSTGPVAENGSRELHLEVRDQYNNPIQGETANLTIMEAPDGSRLESPASDNEQPKSATVTTDEQGRASMTYRAPPNIDGRSSLVQVGASRTTEIDSTASLDRDSPNTVRFEFNVTNADESPESYSIDFGPNQTAIANQPGVTCESTRCTYDGSTGIIDLSIPTSPATPDVPFSVRTDNRSVATAEANTDRTEPNGTAAVKIDVRRPGTTNLTVSSGESTSNISLTVRNQDPTASFEYFPPEPDTDDLVSFSAEASDSDGPNRNLEYEWNFGDEASGFGPTLRHSYENPGIYDVTLTVTDEYGTSTTVNQEINISNRVPTARIDFGPRAPLTNETVVFDASGSDDPDDNSKNLTYEWDLDGDGEFEAENERETQQYVDDGDREVTLRVTDEDGAMASTTATMSVRNREPVPEFGYSGDPTRGESIEFDGSASVDRDGSITSYEWDFGDGTISIGVSPGHIYDEAGTYTVVLETTDDDNTSATKRKSVAVDDREPTATNQPPTAAFEIDPSEPRTGDEVESDAWGSSDPDGDDLDYRWELTYPSGRTETAQGETPTTDPLPPGEYRITLTVTDGDDTDNTNQTFTVSPGLPGLGGGNSAAIADAVEAVRDVDGDSVTGCLGGQRAVLASDASSWFE